MLAFALSVFAGFFAIMNPIVNTPIFISLTEGFEQDKRRRIAAKSTITAFFIILVLALFGKLIFTLFGLTLPAFRITGGILVFVVGIELLRGEHSKMKAPVNEDNSEETAHLGLAISPLSIPILAGPGTIVTAVNFIAEGSLVQDIITLSIFAFMCFWTFLMFVSGEKIVRYLGKNAVTMIGRLMGLILATLGIHMVTLGVYGSIIEGMHYIAEHS